MTVGVYNNPEEKKGRCCFHNMVWGNKSPTDIDAVFEIRAINLLIYYEAKYKGAEVKIGQRLALEEMCDSSYKGGKDCFVLVSDHAGEPGEDIDLGNSILREYRYCFEWHLPERPTTVNQATDRLMKGESISG